MGMKGSGGAAAWWAFLLLAGVLLAATASTAADAEEDNRNSKKSDLWWCKKGCDLELEWGDAEKYVECMRECQNEYGNGGRQVKAGARNAADEDNIVSYSREDCEKGCRYSYGDEYYKLKACEYMCLLIPPVQTVADDEDNISDDSEEKCKKRCQEIKYEYYQREACYYLCRMVPRGHTVAGGRNDAATHEYNSDRGDRCEKQCQHYHDYDKKQRCVRDCRQGGRRGCETTVAGAILEVV